MVFALTYDILGFILKGKSTASNDLDSVYDRFYLKLKKFLELSFTGFGLVLLYIGLRLIKLIN